MTPLTDESPRRAAEFAPSDVSADEPTAARLAGAVGLALAVLGAVAVIANQYGPRWIGTGGGYVFAALGLAAMLYHATRDADREFRRSYAAFGLALLLAGLVLFVLPGKPSGSDAGA